MKNWTGKLCAGLAMSVGFAGAALAGYAEANPLKYTDPPCPMVWA
jgi:hypothetical protein